MMRLLSPSTPSRDSDSSQWRVASNLQDSPFSDYFTDDARSETEMSSETQQMVSRLHRLQAKLVRDERRSEKSSMNLVGKRLDALEGELRRAELHARASGQSEDSVLFTGIMEEEEEEKYRANITPSGATDDGDSKMKPQPESQSAEQDHLIELAQQVMTNVTEAHEQLEMRQAEINAMNESFASQLEEHSRQVEALRSENEGLRLDIQMDYSELLFLKLQFKTLEYEVDRFIDGLEGRRPQDPRLQSGRSRNETLQDLDHWRKDWGEVDGRMRRRRISHGVLSPVAKRHRYTPYDGEADIGTCGDSDWELETVEKSVGRRVESITIRRTAGSRDPPTRDATPRNDDQANADAPRESLPQPKPAYSHRAMQTCLPPISTHGTQTSAADLPHPFTDTENLVERELDCAITSSSEDDDSVYSAGIGEADVLSSTTSVAGGSEQGSAEDSPLRVAWLDLWEGLSNMAGMGEGKW